MSGEHHEDEFEIEQLEKFARELHSICRRLALAVIERQIELELLTANDIVQHLTKKGYLRLRCPKCGHPIEEVKA